MEQKVDFGVKDIVLRRSSKLVPQIVLVDGITRAGKSLLGPILGSLDRVEIERVEAIFEYIALLYGMGKIARDAAVELLQLEADTKLYESSIGRNTNFRRTDHSSVFNNPFKLSYFKRLFRAEGQPTLEDVQRERRIFQVQTHDTLLMIHPFYDAFAERLFVLEMFRDPVDLVHSWYRRGWGRRWVDDPLVLTFTVESEHGLAPWYDILVGRRYGELNEMDRVIFMIEALEMKVIETFESLSAQQKSQILWICFEDFVTAPDTDMARIMSFLGTRSTPKTAGQLKRERCPRVFSDEVGAKREADIVQFASEEGLEKFANLRALYERMKTYCC